MAKTSKNNLMVGAKVLIDYPIRWQVNSDPKRSKQMRAECEAAATSPSDSVRMDARFWHCWGETGVIMAYNPNSESGEDYEVLLDSSKAIHHFHYGALTVTELPRPDAEVADLLKETNKLLLQILGHLKQN